MRPIDADALYKTLEEIRMDYNDEESLSSDFAALVIELVQDEYLAKAPTIDPESLRPQGKWSGTVCSNCGESTSFYYDCNYCPKCGAKMEQEEDNETD